MSNFKIYDPATNTTQSHNIIPSQLEQSTVPKTPSYGGTDIRNNKYLGGLLNQSNQRIGNTINEIMEQRSYDMPKITSSMLTNKGFNQGLDRIQATNKMKLDLKRRQALNGVLGSLVSGRNNLVANTTSKINNDNRLSNNTFIADKDRAAKRSMFDKKLMQDQSQFNETMRSKQVGGLTPYQERELEQKDRDFRLKNYSDDEAFKALLPPNIADEISDDYIRQARAYYINTGKIPQFEKESGFFDDDYKPVYTNNPKQINHVEQSQTYDADEKKRFEEWKKLNGY